MRTEATRRNALEESSTCGHAGRASPPYVLDAPQEHGALAHQARQTCVSAYLHGRFSQHSLLLPPSLPASSLPVCGHAGKKAAPWRHLQSAGCLFCAQDALPYLMRLPDLTSQRGEQDSQQTAEALALKAEPAGTARAVKRSGHAAGKRRQGQSRLGLKRPALRCPDKARQDATPARQGWPKARHRAPVPLPPASALCQRAGKPASREAGACGSTLPDPFAVELPGTAPPGPVLTNLANLTNLSNLSNLSKPSCPASGAGPDRSEDYPCRYPTYSP